MQAADFFIKQVKYTCKIHIKYLTEKDNAWYNELVSRTVSEYSR